MHVLGPLLLLFVGGCSSGLAGSSVAELNGGATSDLEGAGDEQREGGEEGDEGASAVVLRMYGMSRCPHCTRAIMSLVPLARELGDRFRLELDYIGEIVEGEPQTLHGEAEIIGNMIELCVHSHSSYRQWMQFLECYHREWRQIPDGWEECGNQNQINLGDVARCVEGDEGRELLEASFQRGAEAEIDAAPTIVIDDGLTIVGVRSGQRLAQVVCAQYEGHEAPPPSLCELVDPLPYVPVTVVTDERCTQAGCDVSAELDNLRDLVWGAQFRELTYQSEPGLALYRAAGLKRLPALLIGEELEDDREAHRELRYLRRGGSFYLKTLGRFDPVDGEWDPTPDVRARLLNDSRCPARSCSTKQFEGVLESVLPSVEIENVDYRTKTGRELFTHITKVTKRSDLRLPLVLFSKNILDDEEFYGRVESQIEPVEDEYLFDLGEWDPTTEVCDNDEDDDGDGRVDCRDDDCSDRMVCRPEKGRRLELFAMSQCPFATTVFTAMKGVVDHFGRQRSKIDFRIHYIGEVGDEGELHAMHGPAEVEENMRQMCIQHLYSKNYAFMDYLACRAGNFRSDDWQQCITAPLEVAAIERCTENGRGRRLLRESYEYASGLGVTGSPSWLLNNRHEMSARSARAIVAAFCEHNQLPECEREVEVEEGSEGPPPNGCD